jgi:hypothetical protein
VFHFRHFVVTKSTYYLATSSRTTHFMRQAPNIALLATLILPTIAAAAPSDAQPAASTGAQPAAPVEPQQAPATAETPAPAGQATPPADSSATAPASEGGDQAPAVAVEATAHMPHESADPSSAAVPPPAPTSDAEAKKQDLSVDFEKAAFKPGKGLVFSSRDGDFSMAIKSRIQLRYEAEQDGDADPKFEQVFMVRRARLQIAGNFFGKHNKYKLQMALSPGDMQFGEFGAKNSPTFDAIAEFDYLRDFTISVGQFMVPFNRQRIVSSGNFELVDRSLGNNEFQLDRDIGIQANSNDLFGLGKIRYLAAVFMGEGRDAYHFSDTGLLYVGRVEFLPFGDSTNRWDYEEGDQEHVEKPRLSVGAAYAYDQKSVHDRGVVGNLPSDGGTTDFHMATADLVAQWQGVSLSGEFYVRRGKRNFGDATVVDPDTGATVPAAQAQARNGSGWYAQLGYVFKPAPLGLAARFSQVLAADKKTSLKDGNEISFGPSWYIAGHNLKIQGDYAHFWQKKLDDGHNAIRVQLSAGF